MLWGLMGPTILFSSENGRRLFTACLIPCFLAQTTFYLYVMFCVAYVPFVPLHSLNTTAILKGREIKQL